jgi:hypothetical protein
VKNVLIVMAAAIPGKQRAKIKVALVGIFLLSIAGNAHVGNKL